MIKMSKKLTEEEKKLRAQQAAKAKRAFMKKFQPKVYHDKILDGRVTFKSWYELGTPNNPRLSGNRYPRRDQQLEYKRDPINLKRNRQKEKEWREANKDYINFRARMRTAGMFVDKKLWNSFYKLTPEEQIKVLKINPYAPAIVRPKNLVLRRKVIDEVEE